MTSELVGLNWRHYRFGSACHTSPRSCTWTSSLKLHAHAICHHCLPIPFATQLTAKWKRLEAAAVEQHAQLWANTAQLSSIHPSIRSAGQSRGHTSSSSSSSSSLARGQSVLRRQYMQFAAREVQRQQRAPPVSLRSMAQRARRWVERRKRAQALLLTAPPKNCGRRKRKDLVSARWSFILKRRYQVLCSCFHEYVNPLYLLAGQLASHLLKKRFLFLQMAC